MIKEIKNIQDLQKASEQWYPTFSDDYIDNISNHDLGLFDRKSIRSFLFEMMRKTISSGEIMPYLKVWSFEENNQSLAGGCYIAKKDTLTGQKYFEEFMWQVKGALAGSLKEKKMMLLLMRHAEKYAKKSGFDVMTIGRDPNFHKVGDLNIKNNYTNNNFKVVQIQYAKKLK